MLLSFAAFLAPLAQLAEQRTLNPRVRGSSPWRRTRTDLPLSSGVHLIADHVRGRAETRMRPPKCAPRRFRGPCEQYFAWSDLAGSAISRPGRAAPGTQAPGLDGEHGDSPAVPLASSGGRRRPAMRETGTHPPTRLGQSIETR